MVVLMAVNFAGALQVANALSELEGNQAEALSNIGAASQTAVQTAQTTANAAVTTANAASATAAEALTAAEGALPASEAGPLATQAGSSPANAVENALGYVPPQIGTTAGTARDAAAAITAETGAQTTANEALTLAQGALPLSGGTLTGALTLPQAPTQPFQAATKGYVDAANGIVPVTEESSPATLALAFPASGSNCYDVHLGQNLTLTLSGGTTGQYQKLTLILRQPSGGNIAVTLPTGANVLYAGNVPPTVGMGGSAVTVITFGTADGGTTYFGGL
jgi:hypothetical protein